MKKIFQFLKESRAELRKATWPSWEEVSRSTIVVFVTVILFTVFIYLLDKGVGSLFLELLGGKGA